MNSDFQSNRVALMLADMQETRSSFRVQKTVIVAAAASCLALGFASPNAAAAETSDDAELPYCPRPGAEILADDSAQQPGGEVANSAAPADSAAKTPVVAETPEDALRVATYNANLTRESSGELFEELSAPGAEDATAVARAVQTVRPDVLVLTGIDVDAGDNVAKAFNTNYLAVGGDEHTGITYPYFYTSDSNAGVDSGADLNRDGTIGEPGDALGYGSFPGQSSMIVFSKHPLDEANVRDFTSLSWEAMPDNNMPARLTDLERNIIPLASVSHWDIPVEVDGETLHVLATSTADSSESTYGTARNHDQIRFWQDYLDPDTEYILDHRGDRGPLPEDDAFVIAGSLKADPTGKGPGDPTAITSLLESSQIIDPEPARTLSVSGLGRGLLPDTPDAPHHTAPSPLGGDESYRADYVLPSADLEVLDSGVLETDSPASAQGFFGLPTDTNANRIVWADIVVGG
ncbi:3-phytase [Enteractinococcus fodinae]|uniref:3-phytase n=1 Tax=Enteractinococcus fodinae TaxID=684663 RepID=A0ABU2B501_9MICC|nr:3-phytase [Enteractinococcus fodinae]